MVTLRDYYSRIGVDEKILIELNNELKVNSFTGITEIVHEKRLFSLVQAKSEIWEHGQSMNSKEISDELFSSHQNMNNWNRKITPIYSLKGFVIGVARPGKEAAIDYNKINHYSHCTCVPCSNGQRVLSVNNPHDMFPYVEKDNVLMSVKRRTLKNGTIKVTPWTFEHIFSLIENAYVSNDIQFALELLGSIIVRTAFMLDHEKDDFGVLKLNIPELSTLEMTKRLPVLGSDNAEVPIEALIYFLDVLGYNEDIKVDVCGYRNLQREYSRSTKPQDSGRTNTLLTISHMLAAILHRRPIGEFSYGLHRGLGMNAMSKGKIVPAYPLLAPNILDLLDLELDELNWSPQF
jgi:hypothetical protein